MGKFTHKAGELQIGPVLSDLSPDDIKAAKARVRCEYDRTVVAAVVDNMIVTQASSHERLVHDQSIVAACMECPLTSTYENAAGERRPRDLRSLSSRAVWHLVDAGRTEITLDEVAG